MLKRRVFLSYPSSLGDTAARLELSLRREGFSVFRDRSSLPAGESFDDRIREAIADSELFVFLVTPESVTPGRYTLTELKFAEQQWPHPAGRVLPVVAEATPMQALPAYLRAVTLLQPRGNLVAEVAAEVARMGAPWWRRLLAPKRLLPIAVALAVLAGIAGLTVPPYLERRQQAASAAALVQQSRQQAEAGAHTQAWQLLAQALSIAPASREVKEAQEALAMKLLREAGIASTAAGRQDLEELVAKTLPVLLRATPGASGERLGNLLAHQGWAAALRGARASSGGPDPTQLYRQALEADPGNLFAHTMWGYELLRQRQAPDALAQAQTHFAAALQSGRERAYIRRLQLAALLQTHNNVWVDAPERQQAALRVAHEMRKGGEPVAPGWGAGALGRTLWPIYHFGFVAADAQAPLLEALPPAEHLALFRWLFGEADLATGPGAPPRFDHLSVRARLEEHGGDRDAAVASYRQVLDEFESRRLDGARAAALAQQARAALRRLGG